MKTILFIFSAALCSVEASAQFVIKREVKEDIPGICDKEEVYALFSSLQGQQEAICPLTKEQITQRLNAEVAFLKENPKFKGKGMVGLLINCEGKLVECNMSNKTKSRELDKQIESVFRSLETWEAGKLSGKSVDSSILFSFRIKGGKINLN